MRNVELRIERETVSEKGGDGETNDDSVNDDCPWRKIRIVGWKGNLIKRQGTRNF